jgi:hypothetical protein
MRISGTWTCSSTVWPSITRLKRASRQPSTGFLRRVCSWRAPRSALDLGDDGLRLGEVLRLDGGAGEVFELGGISPVVVADLGQRAGAALEFGRDDGVGSGEVVGVLAGEIIKLRFDAGSGLKHGIKPGDLLGGFRGFGAHEEEGLLLGAAGDHGFLLQHEILGGF